MIEEIDSVKLTVKERIAASYFFVYFSENVDSLMYGFSVNIYSLKNMGLDWYTSVMCSDIRWIRKMIREPDYKKNLVIYTSTKQKHQIKESTDTIESLWNTYKTHLQIGYCDMCEERYCFFFEWSDKYDFEAVELDKHTENQTMEMIQLMTSLYKGVCLVTVLIDCCEKCKNKKKKKKKRNMTLEFYEMVNKNIEWYKGDYILVDGYTNKIKIISTRNEDKYAADACDLFVWFVVSEILESEL
ncbi:hypothetical protein F4803DRAFT_557975 [Xylaria telfairii]|nr:hypothetical protein F4803DRAFT_557975 [Xylaria telfairii]